MVELLEVKKKKNELEFEKEELNIIKFTEIYFRFKLKLN